MTPVMLGSVMLIALVAPTAVAHGQSRGSERTRQSSPVGTPDVAHTPGNPGGGFRHGERGSTPESHVPPRSPDLGLPTFPLSPSIGPGSGSLGPEAGRGPSRPRSSAGPGNEGAAAGMGRR